MASLNKKHYPELVKLDECSIARTVISGFLEWLESKKIHLAAYPKDDSLYLQDIRRSTTDILNEYFDIDPAKVEIERQDLLEEMETTQKNILRLLDKVM